MSEPPRPRGRWRRYWGVAPVAIAIGLLALRACVYVAPLDRLAPSPRLPGDPPNATARAGSIDIARGGPIVIGYQSSGPARVMIEGRDPIPRDCHPIASGSVCRIILGHGPAAIRVAGDVRLVWSPVGRRGDPEYVPASSLSPAPPDRAEFEDAGASPADGAIALALLLTLVATLLGLARHRLRRVPRSTWLAMAGVFVAAVSVRWIDLGGFGQAWDEDTNWAAGRNYITNLLGLDFDAASWAWNYEHPPVMKYLEGIGAQFADGFGPARAMSAIWIAIGCALLVPIGARLYRLRAGIAAGAIAALLPPLVAHGQIVGHEAPTVLWWTLGILMSITAFDDARTTKALAIRLAWIAVVIGIATASRFVNGLLGPLCVAIVMIQAPRELRVRALVGCAVMPLVAIATVYLVWPRLWLHPIDALGESFARLTNQHEFEPFLGDITNTPPRYYFLVYLGATLPIGVAAGVVAWLASTLVDRPRRIAVTVAAAATAALLLAIGPQPIWIKLPILAVAAALAVRFRAAMLRGVARADRTTLIALAWLVIPLGVALSPVRQDGVRYVMPCVVWLAFAAAAGLDALAGWLKHRHAFAALATATVIYLGVVDVRTHPYYLDYFGEQVGGTGTVYAHRWFETAWWGEGVDRAVDYVDDNAAPGAKVFRNCIAPMHLAWFREDLWQAMAPGADTADWIVTYSTSRCTIPTQFHLVYELNVDGAVFARVYRR
jgi:hypothetical protein